jgi:hypothetical protein
VLDLPSCTDFISLFSIPAPLLPLHTRQSRLAQRQSRATRLDIEIFLVIEPASFPMNPHSRPASVRGCRCSFPRPSPTFEYLFSVPHSHPVSLFLPIEQPVLTRRANPLLPLTCHLACQRRCPLRRTPSRRYLSRQENKRKRAQHVLHVCTQLRCTQQALVRNPRRNVIAKMMRIRSIRQRRPLLLFP